MKKILVLTSFFILTCFQLSAQTQHQNSGWFLFLNSTKLNDKWGLHLDVQMRSADNWDYVRNTLFRPGVTYYLNKNNNITAGYLWVTTFNQPVGQPKYHLSEHRIWEQYIHTHKIKSVFATHRLRLEQRFIGRKGVEDVFAQRFRYFVRLVQPLKKVEQTFAKGAFVALQNEIFFNVQNKELLNDSFFDQNRAYLALGYRFSKHVDAEIGYVNQLQKGATHNTINNALQLALYTRF